MKKKNKMAGEGGEKEWRKNWKNFELLYLWKKSEKRKEKWEKNKMAWKGGKMTKNLKKKFESI